MLHLQRKENSRIGVVLLSHGGTKIPNETHAHTGTQASATAATRSAYVVRRPQVQAARGPRARATQQLRRREWLQASSTTQLLEALDAASRPPEKGWVERGCRRAGLDVATGGRGWARREAGLARGRCSWRRPPPPQFGAPRGVACRRRLDAAAVAGIIFSIFGIRMT
jgi:hypothetical protein